MKEYSWSYKGRARRQGKKTGNQSHVSVSLETQLREACVILPLGRILGQLSPQCASYYNKVTKYECSDRGPEFWPQFPMDVWGLGKILPMPYAYAK